MEQITIWKVKKDNHSWEKYDEKVSKMIEKAIENKIESINISNKKMIVFKSENDIREYKLGDTENYKIVSKFYSLHKSKGSIKLGKISNIKQKLNINTLTHIFPKVMMEIPRMVLPKIFGYFKVEECLEFRYVCRLWASEIQSHYFHIWKFEKIKLQHQSKRNNKIDFDKNQKFLKKALEDFSIEHSCMFKLGSILENFIGNLLPVHSCGIKTLEDILRDGMFRSKKQQDKSGEQFPSIFKNLKKYEELFKKVIGMYCCGHIKDPLLSKIKMEDCEKCMNLVYNYSEVYLSKLRLGKTKSIHSRYFYLKRRLENLIRQLDIDNIETLCREIFEKSEGKERTGLGYWLDEYLGNDDRVFTVLGPNVEYGPVSIVFKKCVMDKNYEMLINSSTTFISGDSFNMRSWMTPVLEKYNLEYDFVSESLNHFRSHKTSSLLSGSISTTGEWMILKSIWEKSKLNTYCDKWQEIFTKEISGQACSDIAIDFTTKKSKLVSLEKPILSITEEDVINWYLSVDSHKRIEGLLPPEVPLEKIKYLIIPERYLTLELKNTLRSIKTDIYGGTLSDKVIVTKNKKENEFWQKFLFLFKEPIFGDFVIPKDFMFTLPTIELMEYWMKKTNNYSYRSEIRMVDISYNNMEKFPEVLKNYYNMYYLDISNNQFLTIPSTIAHLPNLEVVKGVETNPLALLPREIVLEGWRSIREHIKVKCSSVVWNKIKLVFVGKEGTGKTSAVYRLRKIKYNDNVSTNGIEISTIPSSIGVEFECFDLGGQLIFYPSHKFFLSSVAIYVVTFDVTDELYKDRLIYWVNTISDTIKGIKKPKIVLMGTHIDLISVEKLENFKEELKCLVKLKNLAVCSVYYVSCVKNTGIKELEQGISDIVTKEGWHTKRVPSSYKSLAGAIDLAKKRGINFMSFQEFEKFSLMADIPTEDLASAIKFLNNVGVLMYFEDDESLKDVVILNCQWLASTMSDIISYKTNFPNGMAYFSTIEKIWFQYSKHIQVKLIKLLEKFEIIYTVKKDSQIVKIVIPSLLHNQPDNAIIEPFNRTVSGLYKRYERIIIFGFIPVGFMGKLITRIIHISNLMIDEVWRNGIVVHIKEGLKAMISLDYSKKSSNSYLKNDTKIKVIVIDTNLNPERTGKFVIRKIKRKIIRRSNSFTSSQIQNLVAKKSTLNETSVTPTLKINFKESQEDISVDYNPNLPSTKMQPNKEISEEKKKQNIENFQSSLFNAIDETINNFFSETAKRNIEHLIFCPVCIEEKSTNNITFKYETCVESFISGNTSMKCDVGHIIPVLDLAPDISFGATHLINNLTYEKFLGKGGFGSVSKAKMQSGFEVAVKELLNSQNFSIKDFKSFQHEVFIHSKLNHPNLVKLFGITLEQPPKMVMEFVDGLDLSKLIFDFDLMPENKYTTELQLRYALDISYAINYIHTQNPSILHQDLRSPNILTCSTNVSDPVCAKLADFGLALEASVRNISMNNTWNWMPPEALSGDWIDEKSDIYSFSMLLSEIFTRKIPFTEYKQYQFEDNGKVLWKNNAMDVQKAILVNHLRPTLPNTVPEEVSELVKSCWDFKPEKRPSASDCTKIFKKQLKTKGFEFSQPKTTTEAPITRGKSHTLSLNSKFLLKEEVIQLPVSFKTLDCFKQVGEDVWLIENDGSVNVVDATTFSTIKIKFNAHKGKVDFVDVVHSGGYNFVWTYSSVDSLLILWRACKNKKPQKRKTITLESKLILITAERSTLITMDNKGDLRLFSTKLKKTNVEKLPVYSLFNTKPSCFCLEKTQSTNDMEIDELIDSSEDSDEGISSPKERNSGENTPRETSSPKQKDRLPLTNSTKATILIKPIIDIDVQLSEEFFDLENCDAEMLFSHYNVICTKLEGYLRNIRRLNEMLRFLGTETEEYNSVLSKKNCWVTSQKKGLEIKRKIETELKKLGLQLNNTQTNNTQTNNKEVAQSILSTVSEWAASKKNSFRKSSEGAYHTLKSPRSNNFDSLLPQKKNYTMGRNSVDKVFREHQLQFNNKPNNLHSNFVYPTCGLWLADYNNVIKLKINPTTKEAKNAGEWNYSFIIVDMIYVENTKNLWIASENKVYVVDSSNPNSVIKEILLPVKLKVVKLVMLPFDNSKTHIWVITQATILIFHSSTFKFLQKIKCFHLTHLDLVAENTLLSITEGNQLSSWTFQSLYNNVDNLKNSADSNEINSFGLSNLFNPVHEDISQNIGKKKSSKLFSRIRKTSIKNKK